MSEDNPGGLYQPIRMQGQHYDEESGLHYNRYRYYDPHSGRYITQDPIGLLGGMNIYQYSLSPVRKIDPLGLESLRPDGHPWGYGCGDASTDRYVPDSFGAADFLPACRSHDICYATFGTNKEVCDDNFGSDLALACKNDLTGLRKLYRPVCYGVAKIYKTVVKGFGGAAFSSAQKIAESDYKKLEMLDFLKYHVGIYVDPEYHQQVYNKVINPE